VSGLAEYPDHVESWLEPPLQYHLDVDLPTLFYEPGLGEDQRYLSEQLITYIGNKRSLLAPIEASVLKVMQDLGIDKLRTMDAFSGSGVVARMLKQYSSLVVANDLEHYSSIINSCYLSNQSEVPVEKIKSYVEELNAVVEDCDLPEGFIRRLYSPKDAASIEVGERVFYTPENAARIDNYRRLISSEVEAPLQPFLLAPLLSEASIHTNTAGVFKGFYKDSKTGKGKFGGNGEHALERICGRIELASPVFSNFESDKVVLSMDVRDAVKSVEDLDLIYLDPPYNQHPYGSNYFMLNLIADYIEPESISEVSGIPDNWNRSPLNKKPQASSVMEELLQAIDAKYVLISYNSEGFIAPKEMREMLNNFGETEEVQIQYNTYRGSRNLSARDKYVTEHLYLVRKHR
jgi:adenine-specific DNA-methyltransferase